MKTQKGGIGADLPEAHDLQERPEPAPEALHVEHAVAEAEKIEPPREGRWEQLDREKAEFRSALDHLAGRVTQIEQALGQYAQAFNTLAARIDAVGGGLADQKLRATALDLAIKAIPQGSPSSGMPNMIVDAAEKFLVFLNPIPPETVEPVAGNRDLEAAPPTATAH